MRLEKFKKILSWALYDWANSAFPTTVMAGFFPVFFKQYWNVGVPVTESTFNLGIANSLASMVVAVMAPVLGAIADKSGRKIWFLSFFAVMGIVMTGSLYFVARGDWFIAVFVYIFAIIGFSGGNIFYDALIINVSNRKNVDLISSLGFSLGYLGGGLLFSVNVLMTLKPHLFGLDNASEAIKISFVTVSIWWAIFSIPVFLFVREERKAGPKGILRVISAGLRQFVTTFKALRNLRVVALFLLGYWLYIDGVDTIVRMAVDYGMALGFDSEKLIIALLITQFVGFPSAIAFGFIGQRFGSKTGIFIGIGVYIVVSIWAIFIKHIVEFYILAITIGLVQGGVQSLSRSFYTRIIPHNKAAEFFGFYNMLGKFAAVLGPILMGTVSIMTGNPRYSLLVVVALFIAGGTILFFVNELAGRDMAHRLARD